MLCVSVLHCHVPDRIARIYLLEPFELLATQVSDRSAVHLS